MPHPSWLVALACTGKKQVFHKVFEWQWGPLASEGRNWTEKISSLRSGLVQLFIYFWKDQNQDRLPKFQNQKDWNQNCQKPVFCNKVLWIMAHSIPMASNIWTILYGEFWSSWIVMNICQNLTRNSLKEFLSSTRSWSWCLTRTWSLPSKFHIWTLLARFAIQTHLQAL